MAYIYFLGGRIAGLNWISLGILIKKSIHGVWAICSIWGAHGVKGKG